MKSFGWNCFRSTRCLLERSLTVGFYENQSLFFEFLPEFELLRGLFENESSE